MSNDLYSGSHKDLRTMLDKVYDLRKPLFIHGTFGIGKTKGVEQFARDKANKMGLEFSMDFKDINDPKKFCFISIILHQYDAGEIKGIPFPSQDRTHTIYLPVGLLPEKGQGIIFFDEMNLAPPMMQNNAYQLIEDRRLGHYVVPDGYIAIGAGNLVDDRGNTYDMPMPLNNRFLHFHLNVPSVTDSEINGIVIPGWVNGYALKNKIDNRIINYLNYQPQYLFSYKPESTVAQHAVASPRMWEKISDMIENVTDESELEMFIASGVGIGIAREFVAWLKLSKKYNIKAIFDGKEEIEKPHEVDVLFSLISALVGYYIEQAKPVLDLDITNEKATKINKLACKFLELSQKFNKEHTVMILDQAKSTDNKILKRVQQENEKMFHEFSENIFELVI